MLDGRARVAVTLGLRKQEDQMRRVLVKMFVVGLLASAGVVAGACGGGVDDSAPPMMPSAQASTAPAASSAAPSASASSVTAPSASASAPPAPTLPPEFVAAAAAVKTASDKLTPILTKAATCDVLAGDLEKFSKDNAATFLTFNTEASKLSDDQQALAQSQTMQNGGMSQDDQAKLMASINTSALGKCVQKKDKKVSAAFDTFIKMLTAGLKVQPTIGGLAASAMPASSAAPKSSASAAPAPKK